MMDNTSSLCTRIAEQAPQVYRLWCPCRLCHLCAKKATGALSFNFEKFVIDMFYHFDKSSKRIEVLKEYLEFCNSDVKKVLKHTNTMWLSLMKTINISL